MRGIAILAALPYYRSAGPTAEDVRVHNVHSSSSRSSNMVKSPGGKGTQGQKPGSSVCRNGRCTQTGVPPACEGVLHVEFHRQPEPWRKHTTGWGPEVPEQVQPRSSMA